MIHSLKVGNYTLTGVSLAGIYTAIVVPELRIQFDAGLQMRKHACSVDHLFLSHCHGDHIGGLFAMLGIRDMLRAKPLKIYCPDSVCEELSALLKAASSLFKLDTENQILPVVPGDVVKLGRGVDVHVLRSHHRVPCVGYQVHKTTTRLKDEYKALPGAEIAQLRLTQADQMFFSHTSNDLTYITDTTSKVFATNPSVLESKILICEATYLDEKYTVEQAQRGGHMHLDELLHQDFKGEHLVIIHPSQAYSPNDVHRIIGDRGIPFSAPGLDW